MGERTFVFKNGDFQADGFLQAPSTLTESATRTLWAQFKHPDGTSITGMTSGDTLLVIEMEYFVFVEIPQFNRLTSSQLDAVGKYGETYPQLHSHRKKWCAVGDSITAQGTLAQNGYWANSARMLGVDSVSTVSMGGKSLSKPGSSGNPAMCDDTFLATIPSDAWLVTVLGGTNDWQNGHPIGAVDSSDDTTYCGAINHIIDYFSENRPLVRLVFICPTYGELYGKVTSEGWPNAYTNLNGDTMWDFMAACKSVCERRGIPVVLMGQRCGWNNKNIRTFVNDDGGLLHPNWFGGERMADILVGTLREILPVLDSWE